LQQKIGLFLAGLILLVLPAVAAQEGKDTGYGFCPLHKLNYKGATCPACSKTSSAPGLNPGGSAGSQMLRDGAGLLGAALGEMLRGDPGRAARLEVEAQERAMALQRAMAEYARKQTEIHRRLRSELKLDNDDDDLKLKGIDGEAEGDLKLKLGDEDLKPLGTRAAPNSGAPETAPNTDPMVVDLRDLRRAASLIGTAESAASDDAPLLFDKALMAANGDKSLAGAATGATGPAFDEKGFLEFQLANSDYRKAYDFHLKCSEAFTQAQRRRELAAWMAGEARADLEKAKAGLATASTLQQKQKLLADVFAASKSEDEAWAKAGAELAAARRREEQAKEEAIRILRANVAGKNPANFHPPIASLPSFDDAKWMQVQEKMAAQRAELDLRTGGYRKQLKEMEVPSPPRMEHFHEGVVLGARTDASDAQAVSNLLSPFSGRTPAQLNAAAQVAKENGVQGVGGALVVSFGTPKSGTLPQQVVETTRYVGDHFLEGRVSLGTPEGKRAVEMLAGKEFDRLTAHSNGASIAEALIREDLIKVKELNVLGGDRSMLNRHAFQQLIDSGKVQRVVVWINVNDPVPWVTAPDQLKAVDRGSHALERIARKITGDLEGGDSRVEYRFMVGQGKGLFGPHYIETYYANVAKEFGSSPTPSRPAGEK
jgi:hypothetical protein